MSNTTREIPQEQADRIKEFAEPAHMTPQATYTIQEFMHDLAEAKLSGDLDAVSAVRARGRAASIGFNSNAGRQTVDGVAYQNAMRDAW